MLRLQKCPQQISELAELLDAEFATECIASLFCEA
jgi:hypothetical protein